MKNLRVLLGAAITGAIGLALFLAIRSEPQSGEPRPSLPSSDSSPSIVSESPTPSAISEGPRSRIELENLTTGSFSKKGITTSQETSAVTIPADSFVLVHLMSCCDHASVPTVTGGGLTFDLVVTHQDGEKRHWVLGAASEGRSTTGPLTFTFDSAQDRILWVVDAALGVELGSNGADAVVQTAWQNSMPNAESGVIPLNPFEDPRNAMVGFALAGSGAATDIVPGRGMTETAETEVQGSSLLIDTFWRIGEDTTVEATFVDEAGSPAVQSWLFLAIELRARSASP